LEQYSIQGSDAGLLSVTRFRTRSEEHVDRSRA
jgi:hypothetical protein